MGEEESKFRFESSVEAEGEGNNEGDTEDLRTRAEEIKNIYTGKVSKEALDGFNDEIDKLSGFSKDREESAREIGKILGEDLQDRLAEIAQQMREGVSVAEIMYDAVKEGKNSDYRRVEALEEMGKLMAGHVGGTGDDGEKAERVRQFGEVLQGVAQTQLVLKRSNKEWFKNRDAIEDGYLANIEGELSGFADRDDLPESMKNLAKLAVKKLSLIKKKVDIAAGQGVNEGESERAERVEKKEEPISSGDDRKEELAGAESSSEFVNRPIFERKVIKREDLRAVENQLRELVEKNDPRSAFGLARQLAHLKKARIKMSDKGHEYFANKLQEQVVVMRELGARAVAQYHVYLKYLEVEDRLLDEDMAVIKGGLGEGVVGNKGKVASLTVNAKYLGVIETADMMQDDLQADMKIQMEDGASADRVALEMARRKYLEMPYGLPDNQLHYQQRIDNKLEGYAQEGQWDNYAKLKSYVDYVRGDEMIKQGRREKIAGHVEERAKLAREDGDWGAYTSYVADTVYLSRRQEQAKRDGNAVVRRDEGADYAVNLEVVAQVGVGANKETTRKSQEVVEEKKSREAGGEKSGQKEEPERVKPETQASDGVDPEMYPERAAFEKAAKDHNESQERRAEAEGGKVDVLTMSEDELKLREADLLRRRKSESQGDTEEDRWASKAMEKLRDGADFSEVINETYMMSELNKHKMREPKREVVRQRYLKILRNDFGYAQDLENPTVMDKATSLWMESWYARVKVASGAGKLKAMWPGGRMKKRALRNVISARQDTVYTMREAARDNGVDKKARTFFERLATEYELLNVRDARALGKSKPAVNKSIEETRKSSETVKDTKGNTEDELKKKLKKELKEKDKKKYQEKLKRESNSGGKKGKGGKGKAKKKKVA